MALEGVEVTETKGKVREVTRTFAGNIMQVIAHTGQDASSSIGVLFAIDTDMEHIIAGRRMVMVTVRTTGDTMTEIRVIEGEIGIMVVPTMVMEKGNKKNSMDRDNDKQTD